MQAKWARDDKTNITSERYKELSRAANRAWTECGDHKKFYQPYKPGKAWIPPKEKQQFQTQRRVQNCSGRMWKLFGPNMAPDVGEVERRHPLLAARAYQDGEIVEQIVFSRAGRKA